MPGCVLAALIRLRVFAAHSISACNWGAVLTADCAGFMRAKATAVRTMTRMMHNALIASMAKAWRRAQV